MKWHVLAAAVLAAGTLAAADPPRRTENVVLVTYDGLRWEEVFDGADASLISKERGGVEKPAEVAEQFYRDSRDERRRALLPFLWEVVAQQGQLFGDPRDGCAVRVTNTHNFSYPGYNELLCGFADHRINSNDKLPNPNATVLEWLHRRPGFAGRVAAFTSWDVFPAIINAERSGVMVNSGFAPLSGLAPSPAVELFNALSRETALYGEVDRYDAFTYRAARMYVAEKKPRVLFLSFDETDAQGHRGRYDRVLDSARKNDRFTRELWEMLQSMPEYRGKTSLVISTDHGRGPPPADWKDHGAKVPGCEYAWVGVLGPDTPPAGVRTRLSGLTQGQVAATVAALLGEDYCADISKAARPLPGVVGTIRP